MKKEHMQQVVLSVYDAATKATVENTFPQMKDGLDFTETQTKAIFTPDGQMYAMTFVMVTSNKAVRDAFAKMLSEASDELSRATGETPVHTVPMKGRMYSNGKHVGDLNP